jgi:hypothetical protein
MKPSFFLTAVLFALLLGGCDVTGPEDTVILNANSLAPPIVEYTFTYETKGGDPIGVRSNETDDLGSILSENGFDRSDVVSARVDSVSLERISSKAAPTPMVFDYLTEATAYLGSSTDGTRIADASIDATPRSLSLPVVGSDVTSVVRNGATHAFLQLDTTSDVPDRRDKVKVTVYFQVEVQGV